MSSILLSPSESRAGVEGERKEKVGQEVSMQTQVGTFAGRIGLDTKDFQTIKIGNQWSNFSHKELRRNSEL